MTVIDGLTTGGIQLHGASTGTVEEITSANGGTDITITNGANANGRDLRIAIDGMTGKDGGGALKNTTDVDGTTDMTDGTEDGHPKTPMIGGTTSGEVNGIAVQSHVRGGTDGTGAMNANDFTSEEMTGRSGELKFILSTKKALDVARRLFVADSELGTFYPIWDFSIYYA
ncbi:unnamed protein product [Cylicocyclus nassatus]|uniref:Uncharacterized protein n=1 Tax=Cylicocyclus nassatus TaxID=53992 RepID=A0AA36DNI4_CYLNA|nr:unnamed protein product [Cylicocyclus nassatus]